MFHTNPPIYRARKLQKVRYKHGFLGSDGEKNKVDFTDVTPIHNTLESSSLDQRVWQRDPLQSESRNQGST